MEHLQLSIDEDRREFILSGNTQKILTNHRAKYYFLDFLKAIVNSDRTISIPYEIKDQEQTLKKIQESLQKYGIEQQDSQTIRSVLNRYFTEKENFKIFSQKAKAIWHNEVEPSEFNDFKNIVQKVFPQRILYPQQLLASFHMAFSQNACNFSVPGAGKTSIVYGAYAYLKSLPETDPKHVSRLLIIGPLSSFGPWENEFEECFGYRVNSKRLSGGIAKEERDRYLLSVEPIEKMPELTLMSYQSVSYNLEALSHFLQRKGNKVMVVLDEAHKIKNVDGGVWAQSVLSIAQYCSARVVLTGTPVPNGYEDIFNLYNFIWPDKNIINYTVYQLQDMSHNSYDSRVSRLIDDISPFFIRIKKRDLGLPPYVENDPILIDMGSVQRDIYDFIENRYIGFFTDNADSISLSAELSKARFIRLMQAATNPNLLRQPLETYFRDQGLGDSLFIDDTDIIGKILRYREIEPVPSKFIKAKEIVSNLISKKEKVIIWATFIQNIKELQKYLADNGIESRTLIGETPIERDDISMEAIETREKIIKAFHEESSFNVIIANPFAVSESISLHKACHNAIYLERTFNAANFIQSKDRIHRVGLSPDTTTYYHYLLSRDSIDETINLRLRQKEQKMLELIESMEIPLMSQNMNFDVDLKDDVKAIIRDYVRRTTKI